MLWNAPVPAAVPLDVGAERAHRGGRIKDIFGLEQTLDCGLSDGERTQNKGAMRDGFVAGYGRDTPQSAGSAGLERPKRLGSKHLALDLRNLFDSEGARVANDPASGQPSSS